MIVYCTVCNHKAFPSEAALLQHSRDSPKHRAPQKKIESNSTVTVKPVPAPSSASASALPVVAATPQPILGPHHCKTCRLDFPTKVELSLHYKSGYSATHPKCIRCGEGFEDRGSLNFHMSWMHPMKLCEPCQKWVYLSEMAKHLAQTPLHSPYECAPCNLRFVSMELLKKHYRDDAKLHPVCHKCSEGFKDEDDLLIHSESMHPSVFCDVCKVGVAEEDLGRHWTESLNHPTCYTCDVSFESEDTFAQHLFEVHPELCCRACAFASETSGGLQVHFNTSSSHPKCPACNIGFSTAGSLQKHFCLASRQVQTPPTQIQVAPLSVVVELSSSSLSPAALKDGTRRTRNAICERCDRQFKDDASLGQHYRDHSAHPTCRLCSVGFKDAAAYDSHVSSTHPSPPNYSAQQDAENAGPAVIDKGYEETAEPGSEETGPSTAVELPEASPHNVPDEADEVTAPSAFSTPRSASNVTEHPVLEISPPVARAYSEPPLSSVFASSARVMGDITGEDATTQQSSEPQSWVEDERAKKSYDYAGDVNTRVPSPQPLSTTAASESSVTPSPTLTPQALSAKLEPITTSPVPIRPPSIFSPPIHIRNVSPCESPRHFTFRRGGSSRVSESTSAPGSPGSARSLLFSRAAPVPPVQTEANGEQHTNVSGNDNVDIPRRAGRASSFSTTSYRPSSSSRHRTKSAHAETTETPTTTATSRTHIENDDDVPQAPLSREQKPVTAHINMMDAPPSRPVLSWDCRVCAHPPIAPTTTLCGHLFCLSCIVLELQKHGQCPVCRRPVLVRLHVEA